MPRIEVEVADSIFARAPMFARGVVLAQGLVNTSLDATLSARLDLAAARFYGRWKELTSTDTIQAWRAAHRALGSDPKDYPPAHEALLRRVASHARPVPYINTIVAAMNTVSLELQTPVGGDDADVTGGKLALRPAKGDELFSPLGRPEVRESPRPAEVVYVCEDSREVMCRRWNWRNGDVTKITPATTRLVANVDIIGEDAPARAAAGASILSDILLAAAGGEYSAAVISESAPRGIFDLGS